MRFKPLVLFAVILISLFATIPFSSRPGVALPPVPGSSLWVKVYPDRSIGIQASQYNSSVPYTKNLNINHTILIFNFTTITGAQQDILSTTQLYVGRNASVIWSVAYSFTQYNHTLTVVGPGTSLSLKVYGNATLNPALPTAKVRFNATGTYTFQSTAITTQTHVSSTPGRILVIAAEENEPANTNFSANLNKLSSEVLMTENLNTTQTAFQKASLGFPLNATDSFSATGTIIDPQNTGTLSLHAISGVSFPLSNFTLPYSINDTYTTLTGTVGIVFNPASPVPFTNHTIFDSFLALTLNNWTWVNSTVATPLRLSSGGKLTLSKFNFTATHADDTSAVITIKIVIKGDLMRFLITGAFPGTKITKFFNDTLTTFTRCDYTVTYTKTSGMIVETATCHLVSNLDSRFEVIKKDWLSYMNMTGPKGQFLNQTIFTVSALNIQQTFTNSYSWQQVTGISALPPTVTVSNGFKEFGLFNYTGYMSSPLNFTLVGGSNGTNTVKIILPAGAPTPTTSSPGMDTWKNFQNFTKLRDTVFTLAIQTASAPTSPSATPGDKTVTLSWSLPASVGGGTISSYKIYRATTSGAEVMVNTASSLSFTDTGLTDGQTYYYQVSAVNAGGEGLLSTEVAATPSAAIIDINESPFTLSTNSSILSWTYNANATTGVATFQVNGSLGQGYLKITVPKTLVQYSNNVTITFDGNVVTPTVTYDSNNFYFTLQPYGYTTHNIKIILALASLTTAATTPFPWLIVAAVLIIILVAGGGVYWYSKRRSSLKMPSATSPTPSPMKP